MTEQAPAAGSNEVTLNIKGPSELKLSITISTSKTVLELKQAIAEKTDVSADRQRLIYSGRVLKDEDALSTYKVQNTHTVHMVKGAPKPTGSGSSSTPAPAQPLPTMQTGQTSTETLLNGPRGHGALAGLNINELFGGANPNDPNMMQNMLSSPQFMQQMSRMMSDPNLMDSIIAQSPHLANMDPNMRRTLQSPEFRQMMSNPDTLRNMMQMTAALRQAGIDPMSGAGAAGGMGGFGGGGGFGGMPFDMFGGFGGAPNQAQGQGQNQPSGNLFAQAATGATTATSPTNTNNPASPGTNPNPASPGTQNPNPSPFGMIDPALIQQILGGAGGLGGQGNAAGGNPFAALGGFGAPPAPPPDPRPVEERFQVQLQQLQDMGFTNAQQNVRALLACGGRVDSAIEYILGGGGLE
ncbi:unnamed protein product [Rhizoctonia solani]|uniref:Deubiquitination-protection protein dph1 [Schizosaccharomyces pombe 972h-] n=1 Tax=Rhizoctonia solani TaxID=456999 RepID=A0A8H2WZM9_9AGAM|nr:unnamed protein product [Rhizoctonia solani]